MKRFEHVKVAIVIFFVLIAGFSSAVLAENNQTEPPQTIVLKTLPIASGSFVQRKYFKVLKHPIESQGEVYFDVNIGLLWQTEQPIYSALLLKKHGLFTENGTGASQELKGASAISQVLLNIMSGDSEKISENFIIKNSAVAHCLSLSPKLTQLAKLVKNVQLCHVNDQQQIESGRKDINHIILHEHSGNRTEIDVQLTPILILPEAVRARLQ